MTKLCTLVLFVDDHRVLLAMKKRGFGSNRWNGPGGKVKPDEGIEAGAIRECQEEVSMTPLELEKVAIHDFRLFEETPDIFAHVFICRKWEGKATESEEMAPQWFDFKDIPYDNMWQDDIFWLPAVLAGKKLKTLFTFDKDEHMIDAQIAIVDKL